MSRGASASRTDSTTGAGRAGTGHDSGGRTSSGPTSGGRIPGERIPGGRMSSGQSEAWAFEAAVVPLMAPLLAYFVRRVLPVEDAADCLSEAMVVLWRQRATLPPDDGARRAWAFGIAKRVLSNQRRGRIRQLALADRVRAELRVSVQPAAPADEVAAALATFPERDRELVRLIIWDGFGVAEAGSLLGLRAGAARARYARAKERLRALLPG